MPLSTDKWQTQIRRGYLELCILSLIATKVRLYGFEMMEILENSGMSVKEGTLYPLLNRMTREGYLQTEWETEGIKGHPRKFYSLTNEGAVSLSQMQEEFERLFDVYNALKTGNSSSKEVKA